MSQDEEPSVLDYARFHGLIHDHLRRHPLSAFHGPENVHIQLDDPPGVFSTDATATTPPSERLCVSKEVAMLLSSAIAPPQGTHLLDESMPLDTHRRRNLKMELPILPNMHELDMLDLHSRIVPNYAREHLPLEKLDEEKGEGIAWPLPILHLPQTYDALAMTEKFEAPKETLGYLKSVIKPQRRGGDVPNLHDELMSHTVVGGKAVKSNGCLKVLQKASVQPVTPPLLPLSPPAMPFVPSSDTGHLPLLSDHTSPTTRLAHGLEASIMAPNSIVPKKVVETDYDEGSDPVTGLGRLGQLYSTSKGFHELPSSPPIRRLKPDDLKVEGPLTPPLSEQPPPWKTKGVYYREAVMDIIPDMPPPIEKPVDVSSEDIGAFIAKTIAPIAAKVDRGLEQEQLQQADTTRRVTVPIMDFSLPVPPWKAFSADGDGNVRKLRTLLMKTKADHFKNHLWPANGKANREMRWAPFPKELGRIATEEDIPSNGVLADLLVQPECVDISTLVWKPDGLRILDEIYGSDEEELERGLFLEATDMESLVRKRKLDLQSMDDAVPGVIVRDFGNDKARESTGGGQEIKVAHKESLRGINHRYERGHTYPALLGSTISTLGSLESFMGTRSGEVKKPNLISSSYFLAATPQYSALAQLPGKTSPIEIPRNAPALAPTGLSLASPDIAVPEGHCFFVISSSFSSNKKLFRRLRQLFPSAEFIERDFTLYSTSSTSHSGAKVPVARGPNGTMADEADMTLSPGTGLICTTLQKIKQRALPNQTLWSSVRERVVRTSSRYEKLLVIVSEGRLEGDITDVGALDSQDCEALAGFVCLCSQLECEAPVTYVGGGEEHLAKWIVGVMASHAPTSPKLKLLQDQTLWEIFLRRAGMNAYGAQVVLAELKCPVNGVKTVPGSPDPGIEFGLTAFVKMSLEERLRRFETIFGGRRLLLRVSKALDARW
ncbi:MAG: hypothetical protein FRX48_09487 [Lasallia pustulata]|uniref:Uncharacterized protein n=1 Tax=Lasallia pustulata TaxID=136370 RepID=A0A5M8PCU9_9LECA|nr:MAG: hypothetical protein FRX48_09487 [Lasallia pustulata]